MLYYAVSTLFILDCLLLIVVILLQQGKGGDMANAFGGGGSQAVFGARSGATLLTRATSVLGALFVVLALTLTIMVQRGPGSVVGGVEPPAAPAAPANASSATTTPAPPAASGNTTPK
jgi:preprotein translocase subunit SecG